MTDHVIETATPGGAAATIALWEACALTRPWNDARADFAQAEQCDASTILIARAGRAVTGSVMVGFEGHRGWVYYLAVAPDRRGAGLGRALMTAAEDWLRARAAPKVQLLVRDGNDAALGFYRALGFEPGAVTLMGKRLDRA